MGMEEVMSLVVEKLKEALLALENFGGDVWVWFLAVLPYIMAAVVLVVVVYMCFCCCGCCCRGLVKMMKAIGRCCCCCCGGGRPGKMMKAPGRNCMMPRSVFESNPKGYFWNLRTHPGDQLC